MITFSHVYKTYEQNHALKDINFQISKGEFVFLTGPSGAGKTTLFRLLSAHSKASSGMVDVAHFHLHSIAQNQLPNFRRRIGVVYQDFRLLNDRNIFDNVALPLLIRGDKGLTVQRRVLDILERVGLADKCEYYPLQLSGGEQQRVAIARAIVHQPEVLIADEPTGNLDPVLSEQIIELFNRVNAQGTTLFVASHDHELVKRHARRLLQLECGVLSEAKV